MLIANALLVAQTSPAGKTYTLSGVIVSGAKRFTQEQLISASGLKKGQQIDLPGIDAAADRLFKTGALANISYTYRTAGTSIEVQFKLAEASKFFPCIYDNFVWFNDQELTAAVRRNVPLFDGSLPVGGELPNQVTEELERFLQEHSIKSGVTALMASRKKGEPPSVYEVRVSDISIPVASVTVQVGPLGPEALAKATHVLTAADYSRSVAHGAGQIGLTEAYGDEGYLQAKFSEPQILMKDPAGRNASLGVMITYKVEAGPLYIWSGIAWSGNRAVPDAELTRVTGFKLGDVARTDKLEWAWVDVQGRYGKDGYLGAQVEATPEFDVAQHQVHFQGKVVEGAQYYMGEFSARGVPEIMANKLKAAWRLREGQLYDTSYEDTFQHHDMTEVMRASATSRFTVTLHRKLDMQNHVVNVELEIK
jgi:outer membrane protein insertion porin family